MNRVSCKLLEKATKSPSDDQYAIFISPSVQIFSTNKLTPTNDCVHNKIETGRYSGKYKVSKCRTYYALQITFRLSPVQIVNFLCPIDEISVIRASIEHKKLTI
jgi:hypothetical protein